MANHSLPIPPPVMQITLLPAMRMTLIYMVAGSHFLVKTASPIWARCNNHLMHPTHKHPSVPSYATASSCRSSFVLSLYSLQRSDITSHFLYNMKWVKLIKPPSPLPWVKLYVHPIVSNLNVAEWWGPIC